MIARGVIAAALALLLAPPAFAAKPPVATLRVWSADLPAGRMIAPPIVGHDWGCTSAGLSPALDWDSAPKGTKSFLITMFDTYPQPQAGWWHWLVLDIPASVHALARGAGASNASLPAGAHMALPDADAPEPRYYGPCPDKGDPAHHYVITVYALDVARLDVPTTATATDIDSDAQAHVLARGRIIRDYRR